MLQLKMRFDALREKAPASFAESWSYFLEMQQTQLLEHLALFSALEQAAIREVYEETGLTIRIVRELGELGVPDGKGGIYEIHDFLAESLSGEVVAGDDAAAIGWFRSDDLSKLPLTPDLLQYLGRYGIYP